MSDRYQGFASTPIGQVFVKNLGLPNPTALERWSEGAPLVDGVVVLGGAVVAFGPGLYADWNNRAAAEEPTLDESSGDAGALDPASLAGDWTVADGSYAGYRVHEVLQGEDVTVTGRTDEVTGSFTVADGTLTEATIEVDMASVATDEPPRDAYFRGDALEVGTYPTATFAAVMKQDLVGLPVQQFPPPANVTGKPPQPGHAPTLPPPPPSTHHSASPPPGRRPRVPAWSRCGTRCTPSAWMPRTPSRAPPPLPTRRGG